MKILADGERGLAFTLLGCWKFDYLGQKLLEAAVLNRCLYVWAMLSLAIPASAALSETQFHPATDITWHKCTGRNPSPLAHFLGKWDFLDWRPITVTPKEFVLEKSGDQPQYSMLFADNSADTPTPTEPDVLRCAQLNAANFDALFAYIIDYAKQFSPDSVNYLTQIRAVLAGSAQDVLELRDDEDESFALIHETTFYILHIGPGEFGIETGKRRL